MTEPPTLREPEADGWIVLARLAALASVALLVLQIILLLTLEPSADRCPDWRPGGAAATSLWIFVAVLAVPNALFACLAALSWRRIARRVIGAQPEVPPWFWRGPPRDRQRFWAPATTITACACGIAAAFASAPLLLVASCMEWLAL